MAEIETRIFVVVQTKNGKPRGFEKVSHARFFMIEGEARASLAGMPEDVRGSYQVASVLARFEPQPVKPEEWKRAGTYTAVTMENHGDRVVYTILFQPDAAPFTTALPPEKLMIGVREATVEGTLWRIAVLLLSVGTPEPRGGWKMALLSNIRHFQGHVAASFDADHVLSCLRTLIGKRGGIHRQWQLNREGNGYWNVDSHFPLEEA